MAYSQALLSWWKALSDEQKADVARRRPDRPGSEQYLYLVCMGHKTPGGVLARYLSDESGVPAGDIRPDIFGDRAAA